MTSITAANITDLAGFQAVDETGNNRVFGSFWEDQRAALIFVRHFG